MFKAWFSPRSTPKQSPSPFPTLELAPSYRLPIGLLILALGLLPLSWIASGIVGLLGLFLSYQAANLRFVFTDCAMVIRQGSREIRNFPYATWINWRIFWSPVPILCYFRETQSIHFFPILFDPRTLQGCLEERCPCVE